MSTAAITRETQRDSYHIIKKTLGERQSQVFSELCEVSSEGITASELALRMWQKGCFPMPDRNNVHPRLNELVELRLIGVIGKRRCKVTNKTVAIYRVRGDI